jgi:hypothetical protein
MFLVFKLSFVVDISAFLLATFWAIFKKNWQFFSFHLVALVAVKLDCKILLQFILAKTHLMAIGFNDRAWSFVEIIL